jgi:protein TonB
MANENVKKEAVVDEAPFGHLLASKPPSSATGTLAASLVSIAGHGLLLAGLLWATRAIADEVTDADEQVTIIEVPPELELPPPPPPPEQQAPKVVAEDIPRGFQTLSVPDIVPTDIPPPNPTQVFREADFSGVGVQGGRADGRRVSDEEAKTIDLSAAPAFTPMTVAPKILNEAEVIRALERNYPPLLRDAGIGGDVNVWFFIDEAGKVIKRQINTGSGYPALDDAAMKVADVMRFSPAYNRDKKVQVWVSLPIKFSTK